MIKFDNAWSKAWAQWFRCMAALYQVQTCCGWHMCCRRTLLIQIANYFTGHRGPNQDANGDRHGQFMCVCDVRVPSLSYPALPLLQLMTKLGEAKQKEDKGAATKKIAAHRLETAKVPHDSDRADANARGCAR